MVQEPINRFLLIKHKYELYNKSDIWRLEHFTCDDIKNNGSYFRLKITLSFEISETIDDKFVPRQETLAMNNLKSQCY